MAQTDPAAVKRLTAGEKHVERYERRVALRIMLMMLGTVIIIPILWGSITWLRASTGGEKYDILSMHSPRTPVALRGPAGPPVPATWPRDTPTVTASPTRTPAPTKTAYPTPAAGMQFFSPKLSVFATETAVYLKAGATPRK